MLTHDADFGRLVVLEGEPFTGIVYLRPGHFSAAFVLGIVDALEASALDLKQAIAERSASLRNRALDGASEGRTPAADRRPVVHSSCASSGGLSSREGLVGFATPELGTSASARAQVRTRRADGRRWAGRDARRADG